MRKLTTFAIVMLVLTFLSACSKKDAVKYSLTSDKTDIKYNETAQLKINIGSTADYTLKSSDEFVCAVDNAGKITAKHVGEATITAEKNGQAVANLKINISPVETFFAEPYVEIGASKSIIKSKEKRTLSSETSNSLNYQDPSSDIRGGVLYLFDDSGKMTGVIVGFQPTTQTASRVGRFYAERYLYVTTSENVIFLSDRNKKYSLGIDPDDEDLGFVAVYFNYVQTSGSAKAAISRGKEILRSSRPTMYIR